MMKVNPINIEFFLPIFEIILPRIGETKKLVTLNMLHNRYLLLLQLLTR